MSNRQRLSKNTVTRVQLSDAVYRKAGRPRTECAALVEMFLTEIIDGIERGETVKLSSFGAFVVRKKGERIGRNPKTGTVVPIAPRRVVVFKPSAILKQRIQKVNREIARPTEPVASPVTLCETAS